MNRTRLFLLFGMLLAALATGCAQADDDAPVFERGSGGLEAQIGTCGTLAQTPLMAGQHYEAGAVFVGNDDDNLYVEYTTNADWSISRTHLHVVDDPDLFPVGGNGNGNGNANNQNPKLGHFDHKDSHDPAVDNYSYTIPLDGLGVGDVVYLAAHAHLNSQSSPNGEGAWAAGVDFPGGNWAMFFEYTVQECEEPVEEEEQGCSQGYWRQPHHADSWAETGYDDTTLASDALDVDDDLDGTKLIDALWLRGGHLNALLRQASAALLNAEHPDVNYPYTVAEVRTKFEAALTSGDYEATKDEFDAANNLGCPLD